MVPHAQCDGVRGSCQPYHRASASQKALLWRENPNSSIGSEVSQLEAPFSPASSIALVSGVGRVCFRLVAAEVACCRFSLWISALAVAASACGSQLWPSVGVEPFHLYSWESAVG